MTFGEVDEAERKDLLQEIRSAFDGVTRGTGTSLHETDVVDDYGTAEERAQARLKDADQHWWEVPDCVLQEFEWGHGGFCFMDARGFAYYAPAYMSYYLRRDEDPDALVCHLSADRWVGEGRHLLFDENQNAAVAKFLVWAARSHGGCDSSKALRDYWVRFLPKSYLSEQLVRFRQQPTQDSLLYLLLWLAAYGREGSAWWLKGLEKDPALILATYQGLCAFTPYQKPERVWALPQAEYDAIKNWLRRDPAAKVVFDTFGILPD